MATDRERLVGVLERFAAAGYKTSAGDQCCQSCAGAEMDLDEGDGWLYWLDQAEPDAFELLDTDECDDPDCDGGWLCDGHCQPGDTLVGQLALYWAGDGAAIAAALRQAGFAVSWEGRDDRAIMVGPVA